MFRKFVFVIAIVSGSVGLGASLSAASHSSQHLAADVLGYASAGVPLGSGFTGSRFSRATPNHDNYDGDRYWNGGNCFPTEPGGCN